MSTFYDEVQKYDWETVRAQIYASTREDVERAINRERITLNDFAALVSPAADEYLKEMAAKSYTMTRRKFGKTMQLYVPLYLANYCSNQCIYCGFNCRNQIHRAILSDEQMHLEAKAIQRDPFQHILLVTGEAPAKSSVEYLGHAIEIMKEYFSQVALEVQPLEIDEYKYLMEKGLYAVYVYQETYREDTYKNYHLAGRKRDYRWRLETPDRLCEAGMYKVGLGNLIGLEDWRTEAFYTALHLRYLENKYWRTKYSVAFPRLRPHVSETEFKPNYPVDDRGLLQLICAYRLLSEDVEITISTRESQSYRDLIMPFGVTCMSAGSKTSPGGYAEDNRELEQFAINDDRTPTEVYHAVQNKGLEPVWKDWSIFLQE